MEQLVPRAAGIVLFSPCRMLSALQAWASAIIWWLIGHSNPKTFNQDYSVYLDLGIVCCHTVISRFSAKQNIYYIVSCSSLLLVLNLQVSMSYSYPQPSTRSIWRCWEPPKHTTPAAISCRDPWWLLTCTFHTACHIHVHIERHRCLNYEGILVYSCAFWPDWMRIQQRD